MIDQSIDIKRMVDEYLTNFKHIYHIPKDCKCTDAIEDWCKENLGSQYKDWFLWKGSYHNGDHVLHIASANRSTLFVLTWGEEII